MPVPTHYNTIINQESSEGKLKINADRSFSKDTSTIPEQITFEYLQNQRLVSEKNINGYKPQYYKDSAIVETFEYRCPFVCGAFLLRQTILVDIPKIPSCYDTGFYRIPR